MLKEEPTKKKSFLTFDLARPHSTLTSALNVQNIKEVVEAGTICPLPELCPGILGVFSLRGSTIPVADMGKLLSRKKPSVNFAERSRFIIAELLHIQIVIPVLRTGRMIHCNNADFLLPPPGSKMENTQLFSGLIRKDSIFIPVLNLETLLDQLDLKESEERPIHSQTYHNLSGKKALIVDDSRTMQKKLTQLFENLGLQAVTASNGIEALARLAESGPKYDFIFTDIDMPRLDGLAMAKKIKAFPQWRQIPIIFNSSFPSSTATQDKNFDKLAGYLIKLDEQEIIQQIQNIFPSVGHLPLPT